VYPPVRECLLEREMGSDAYFYNGTLTYVCCIYSTLTHFWGFFLFVQDYPSLGFIESLLRERQIQLVFGALQFSSIILEVCVSTRFIKQYVSVHFGTCVYVAFDCWIKLVCTYLFRI